MVSTLIIGKSLHYLFSVTLVLLMLSPAHLREFKCGKPGHTPLCNYYENKEAYYEGDEVHYSCKEKGKCYADGPMSRECQKNGTWSGNIPTCYGEVSLGSIRPLNTRVIRNNMNYLVDKNMSTCIITNLTQKATWVININLSTVSLVRIFIPTNVSVNIEVVIWENNKTAEVKCGRIEYYIGVTSALTFACPPNLRGNIAKIIQEAVAHVEQSFYFCEVEFYYSLGEGACLKADTPINAVGQKNIGTKNKPSTYSFSCKQGFELVGTTEVQCQPNGKWSQSSTFCKKKIECQSLPKIANGYLITNSTSVNSTAWLKCNEGYRPLSDDRSYCLPTGTWTYRSLHCAPIQCDSNPYIPHGRGILLGGNALYGSRLRVKCDPGYRAITADLNQCQQNSSWGNLDVCVEINCGPLSNLIEMPETGRWLPLNDTITTILVLICDTGYHIKGSPPVTQCLPNGSWSYTTAICRGMPVNGSWDQELTPHTMLMVAIAVGTIVCLLCLACCTLLLMKRKQLKMNSAVFKAGKTDSTSYNQVFNNLPDHMSNTAYEEVIELRHNPSNMNSLHFSLELPKLPPDADPVYAQPFETSKPLKKTSTSSTAVKEELYAAHIYAEPIDSRNVSSTHNNIANCVSETWLRTGAKKFGRKVSLPDHSKTLEEAKSTVNCNGTITKRAASKNLNTAPSYLTEKCQMNECLTKNDAILPEIIGNNIYSEVKEDSLACESSFNQVQMIDNDIYQGDYFSNV